MATPTNTPEITPLLHILQDHAPAGPEESQILQLNCHVAWEVTDWNLFLGFEHVPTNWNDRHKACLYVRKKIGSEKINQLPGGGKLLVGIEIELQPAKSLQIINLYNPPTLFLGLDPLDTWMTNQITRQIATILCMDSNLHHPKWNPPGMRSVQKQAAQLIEMCGKSGFCLSSSPQVPTYYSRKGRGSTIDLCWSNFLASKIVKSVNTSTKNYGLDHQAVIITIQTRPAPPLKKWTRPAWEAIDMESAKSKLQSLLQPIQESLNDTQTSPTEIALRLVDTLRNHQESLGRTVAATPHRAKDWNIYV
ncbi:hypothetical protein PCANC_11433 [Puccinia coronata f. sp. avenae]|uniref:Endonuclease/exonuclease/phosphatase domain-containing protein n=1 Tax=Puccinia coronata f. sp. avenae TaxID=200324 RepID=A0A2N5VMI0_9BASI|nr:hypothetical protein PCANC_11433 [Puccinia coronata f. sp. avenae]